MVRPGGTALFEVPNCEHEYGTDAPHVVFFTANTLRKVLERSGFVVMKCQTCGPSIQRWLPGRQQRLRHFVDDNLPIGLARLLKAGWRMSRSDKGSRETRIRAITDGLTELRNEAKDEAWFKYDQPDLQHSAIRCAAVRRS
jgi:hypothetical protein